MQAKGSPPTDLWGQLTLWWHTSVIGWDAPTWGAVIVGALVLMIVWKAATR